MAQCIGSITTDTGLVPVNLAPLQLVTQQTTATNTLRSAAAAPTVWNDYPSELRETINVYGLSFNSSLETLLFYIPIHTAESPTSTRLNCRVASHRRCVAY